MKHALVALLALATACSLGACERAGGRLCDEPTLERAIAQLSPQGPGDPVSRPSQKAIALLGEACPSVPVDLISMLVRDYVRLREQEQRSAAIGISRVFARERDRMCADIEAWSAAVSSVRPRERPDAMFRACKLGRLGLLDPGEPFLFDDLTAFVTHHWLVRHGAPKSLMRRFTRGLMTATSADAVVERRCNRGLSGGSCLVLTRRHGVDPPLSESALSLEPGVRVTATSEELRLEEQQLQLREGALASAQVESHVIVEMLPRMRAIVARDRAAAESSEHEQFAQITLGFDRATPYGTLINTMYTAHKAGFQVFGLQVVDKYNDLTTHTLMPRRTWAGWRTRRASSADSPIVYMEPGETRFSFDGETRTLAGGDFDGLREAARVFKRSHRHIHEVVLQVRPELPIERVVAALDALRGEECRIEREGESSQVCLLWMPQMDLFDPISSRSGDWDDLSLSIGVFGWGGGEQRRKAAHQSKTRAHLEALLPVLTSCLRTDELARAARPDDFVLVFGGFGSKLSTSLLTQSNWKPNTCFEDALGLVRLGAEVLSRPHMSVKVTIEYPQ